MQNQLNLPTVFRLSDRYDWQQRLSQSIEIKTSQNGAAGKWRLCQCLCECKLQLQGSKTIKPTVQFIVHSPIQGFSCPVVWVGDVTVGFAEAKQSFTLLLCAALVTTRMSHSQDAQCDTVTFGSTFGSTL